MSITTYQDRVAAEASASERADFVRLTYLHLGGAVLAFTAVAGLLVTSPIGETLARSLLGTRYGWLLVLGGFMAVGWVARQWAESTSSVPMQYAGLGLYVVAEAVLFTPLLYVAAYYTDPSVIPTAGALTGAVFGGLTVVGLTTRKDFSFLRSALMLGGFAAMGLVVVSIVFGFSLGLAFSAAMVVLAAGYVLYDTSNVLHHYRPGSHVAASLALFASLALMFWYVLRIVMSLSNRD